MSQHILPANQPRTTLRLVVAFLAGAALASTTFVLTTHRYEFRSMDGATYRIDNWTGNTLKITEGQRKPYDLWDRMQER